MTSALDAVDRSLISVLRGNPRIPTKTLARELGITEQTAAARIRQLQDRKLLRVVVQSDVHALGFEFVCFSDIYVSGRPAIDVAAELTDISGVSAVMLCVGAPEVIVKFHAVDRIDLQRIVQDDFGRVPGIEHVETAISMEIAKYRTEFARLEND